MSIETIRDTLDRLHGFTYHAAKVGKAHSFRIL